MKLEELTRLMREVYEIVYSTITGQDIAFDEVSELLISRKQPAMNVRHIIRYILKRDLPVTNKDVGDAEGRIFKIPARDHTSIINSSEIVRSHLAKEKKWKVLMLHIGFFLDMKVQEKPNQRTYPDTLRRYAKYDQTTLAIAIATMVQNRLISSEILQVILNESDQLDSIFVQKIIKKNSDDHEITK